EGRKNTPLEHIIVTSPADFLPPFLRPLYPLQQRREKTPQPVLTKEEISADPSMHTMQDLLKSHSAGTIEQYQLPVPTSGDDLAVLQYTGGTTGLSKGAMLTHRNLLANALQTSSWQPKAEFGKESGLCVAPFFHSYGLTVCMNLAVYMGGTMVLLPRFNAKDTLKAIRRYRPQHFPGIPTMYIAVMREAKGQTDALKSLEYCISGAAPLPAQVRTDFEGMIKGKLVEGYGLSEASPVTHCNPLTDDNRDGSIGLPLPSVESAIMNPETHELLPAGEIGEIVVKGPNIMQGYWKREDETKAIFVNGWMLTGDIGKMDEDGFFYVLDRSKDLILASGFNVYPREIEEVLFQHPAIAVAAAIGVPDPYRGETVAAFVVLKPDFPPTEETREKILAFCKQELTPYKVPKILEFRDTLPTSLVGKVLRRELREQIVNQQAKQ
ncbi:MAG TPA: AMP-binding protein, partial [Ktedonobacteraceae bacterium]